MSIEAHHRFILDTMQHNQDIARNIINGLEAENARLKAEVYALKLGSLLTAVDVLQFINLKADNERLRKAGDELLDGWIGMYGDHKGSMAENYIELWNAAKEGKPSV